MAKYYTKEQIMNAMEEQNLMLDDIWGVEERLDELPPANVVEVVRCKDCANKMSCYISGIYRDEDNYCFRGTKLDGGENDD